MEVAMAQRKKILVRKLQKKHARRQRIEIQDLVQHIAKHPEKTLKEIGTHFGVSGVCIGMYVGEWNIPYIKKKEGGAFPIKLDELKKYIAKHPEATLKKIGDHFHVTRQCIHERIRYARIPYIKKVPPCKLNRAKLARYIAKHPEANLQTIAIHFKSPAPTVYGAIQTAHIPYSKKTYQKVNRRKLAQFIVKHPEVTLAKVASHFHVSRSTVQYHVDIEHIPYELKR